MNTRYFDNCQSLEEAKSLWRKLAHELHPDHHADEVEKYTELFKQLNAEYARFCATFTKNEAYAKRRAANAEGKGYYERHDFEGIAEDLRVRIEWALNNLPADIDVELCGMWIWLSGNTYPVRDVIGKAGLGFKFARKKQAWFYAGVESFNPKPMTLEEIRSLHGSIKFGRPEEKDERAPLPAHATA